MIRSTCGFGSLADLFDDADDRELVQRVQGGDERAFEELFRRYRPLARKKCRSLFLDGHERDDLFQEALVGVWKAVRGFDLSRDTPFSAFADLCVERQLCSVIKSGNRNKHQPLNSRDSLDASDGRRVTRRWANLAGSAADDPIERAISSEEVDVVTGSFLQALSPFERSVLALFVNGQSYEEIGARLGGSTKSVDNALQRVRKKLRARLMMPVLTQPSPNRSRVTTRQIARRRITPSVVPPRPIAPVNQAAS